MMNRRDVLRLVQSGPDAILDDLSTRQFLRPHQSLGDALAASSNDMSFCPKAAETAIAWLQVDPSRPIGRLRRTELIQLSRSIHRFWQQTLEAAQIQPA